MTQPAVVGCQIRVVALIRDWLCKCVYMTLCLCVSVTLCMCVSVCVYIWHCVYVCLWHCACVCVCVYMTLCLCVSVTLCMCLCVCLSIWHCLYVCLWHYACVCVCVCVYIDIVVRQEHGVARLWEVARCNFRLSRNLIKMRMCVYACVCQPVECWQNVRKCVCVCMRVSVSRSSVDRTW